jgi:hypothetical protein
MKRILLSLVAIATISLSSFGQAPEGFKYQAVVRDAGNLILNNQAVGMQMTIQQGSIGGTTVYQETFSLTTNGYGLVNLEIGSGTVVSGTFATIDWSAGPYFIETAVDVTGGTSYAVMGTSQLMSVPYALYAKTSGNGAGPQGPAGNDGIDGVDGAIGATGADGTNGTNGTDGATGLTGPAGADGQGGVTTAGSGINVTGAGTVVSPYVVSTVSCTYSVGDLVPALGGYIFYLDGSGCHGLVAKTQNEPSTYQWSPVYFDTWAYASGIFGGAQNTKKSIARAVANGSTCPAATQASLTDGVFNDWYLPSKDELDMMYVNLHLQGLGGFVNNFYWSSTEGDFSNAWSQNFANGGQYYDYKYFYFYVRAVRAF